MAKTGGKKAQPDKKVRIRAIGLVIEKTGVKIYRAARLAGVPSSTVEDWLKEPEIAEFFEAKRDKWIKGRLKVIDDAADDGTWQAAAWRLERTDSEDFGLPKQTQDHTGTIEITIRDLNAEKNKG